MSFFVFLGVHPSRQTEKDVQNPPTTRKELLENFQIVIEDKMKNLSFFINKYKDLKVSNPNQWCYSLNFILTGVSFMND